MNVQPAAPVRTATPIARPAAPNAQTLGRVAPGDSLALSAAAKATGGQVVVIDGREYEVKAKKKEWNGVDKALTWTTTGLGAFVGFCLGGPAIPYMGGLAAGLVAMAVLLAAGGGIGYGIGRVASNLVNGTIGLIGKGVDKLTP